MTRTRRTAAALSCAAGLASAVLPCHAQVAPARAAAAAPRRPAAAGTTGGTALVVNVLDFGAKADHGVTDNSDAFQAAIDHVAGVKGGWPTHGGIVHVPGAPSAYGFHKPIFIDHDGIILRGDSWQTTQLAMVGTAHPLVVVGVRRAEIYDDGKQKWNVKPDASNHPDLAGKLDASAAPGRGKRWGFRSRGSTFLQFQATPWTLGVKDKDGANASDDWNQTTAVTLEVCCEPPDGQRFPPRAPIAGAGRNDPMIPAPFYLRAGDEPGEMVFYYRSSTLAPDDRDQFEGFHFNLGDAAPPYRISVSVDLAAGTWSAFVNGQARPVRNWRDRSKTTGTFTTIPGTTFAPSLWEPWLVGAMGPVGPVGQKSSGIDLRLYGLRLSRGVRYTADDRGRQLRADTRRPPDDAWAYFGDDKDTVAFLPFDTPPSDSRLVTVANGGATYGGRSSGMLLHIYNPQGVSNAEVTDLTLTGGGQYGYALALGAVIEPRLQRLKAVNASYAIGSFLRRDNYRIHLADCQLNGSESGYFGYEQIVLADRIMFDYAGRDTIRLVGSGSRWRDVMVAFWSPAASHTFQAIELGYGGAHTIENLVVDFEGPGYRPGGSGILFEAHPNRPASSLRLRDCFFGTVGKVPLIELKGASPANPNFTPAWFDAENVQAYTNEPTVLKVEGPLWHGSFRGLGAGKGLTIQNTKRFGAKTNVTIQP